MKLEFRSTLVKVVLILSKLTFLDFSLYLHYKTLGTFVPNFTFLPIREVPIHFYDQSVSNRTLKFSPVENSYLILRAQFLQCPILLKFNFILKFKKSIFRGSRDYYAG